MAKNHKQKIRPWWRPKFISAPRAARVRPLLAEQLEPRVLFSAGPTAPPESVPETGVEEAPVQVQESPAAPLTTDELAPLIDESKNRWRDAGLSEAEIAELDLVSYELADLEGLQLAVARDQSITLDQTAAGLGWFVDPTPGEDEEFAGGQATGEAQNGVDLLTALMHEQAHILGIEHDDSGESGLLASILETGERRPATAEVVGAPREDTSGETHALTALAIDGLTITSEIDEGGTVSVSGRVSDDTPGATFRLIVNWDQNGSSEGPDAEFTLSGTDINDVDGLTWNAATREFSLEHVYPDDNPTATASDIYDVSVRLEREGDPANVIPIGQQLAKLTSSTAAPGDEFGANVAISGNFAAVGVPFDDNPDAQDSGAVIIYERQLDQSWVEVQRVTAKFSTGFVQDDFEFGDWFGGSVALDGNLLVVGAVHSDVGINTRNEGAAYVYERNTSSGEWEFRDRLLQFETDVNIAGFFGSSVAIENETIIVGALGREVDGNIQAGAAYVFERVAQFGWEQAAKVTASDPGNGFRFGESVAISGNRFVVGAPQNNTGEVYVFEKSGGSWVETHKLIPSDGGGGDRFGISVDIEEDVIVVGARVHDVAFDEGAAYVYEWNGGVWEETKLLHVPAVDHPIADQFGSAVTIDGGIIAISASQNNFQTGAVYLFEKDPANGWEQYAEVKADDGSGGDQLGFIGSMAMEDGVVLVGSRFDDDDGTSSGSAYLFAAEEIVPPTTRTIEAGTQLQKVTSSTAAPGDEFGAHVAISGDFAAVGVPLDENSGADNSGSVVLFQRQDDDTWVEIQRVTAQHDVAGTVQDDFEFGDWFGGSVAIQGNLLVVGAVNADTDINTRNEGAVYIYERNPAAGEWEFRDKLLQDETDVNIAGFFGSSVAIEGETIVVGALGREVGGNVQAGATYVFERTGAFSWTETAKVTASDPGNGFRFGESVSIDGDRVVVGAPQNGAGGVYVFEKSGGVWAETIKLVSSDGNPGDRYGISVDVEGDTIVVGARLNDAAFDEGAAYIYELNAGIWSETKLVHAPSEDFAVGDHFGSAVSIDNGIVVISASQNNFQEGAAYLFRNDPANGWEQFSELKATDAEGGDQLGFIGSIAIDNGVAFVGARFDDDDGTSSGSAYFFAAEDKVVLDDSAFETTLQTTVNNVAPELSEERGDSDFFDFVENGLANRVANGTLTVTDPGTEDTHTAALRPALSVSGTRGALSDADFLAMLSVVETVENSEVEWSFDSGLETFAFLDEGDSLTLRYTIEVADDDGSVDSRAVTIQVYGSEEAVSPLVEDLTVTPVINEGGEVAVTGRVVDPNADDTFSLTVIWDAVGGTEGPGDSFALGDQVRSKVVDGYDWDPATRIFTVYHVYADDNPTDTPLDEYQLYVTLSDRAASGSQQWLQLGEDIDGDVAFDLSGDAVAMSADGRTIAVASPLSDASENNAGAVDVYFWNETDSRWEKRGASIAGISAGEESGASVAMSDDGNTLIIGASRNDDAFTNAGQARVYDWNAGSEQWEQRGDVLNGESGGALAGHAVALSGDGNTAVVGEFGDDQARVYAWNSGTGAWEQKGLDLESVRSLERFGFSVDLSSDGDTVIVGSRENSSGEPGHVRVYDFVGGAWLQRGSDVEGESVTDQFGYSVALSADGNTFIAGAIHNDDVAESAGHARIYDWDDTSNTWVQRGLDLDGDAEDDQFGSSVGMSADGNTVIIGAPFNNDNGSNAGLARVYVWNESSSTWERKGYHLDGEDGGDESGTAVAISADGETILIGAHGNNAGGSDAGHAKVYRWVDRLETTEVFEDYLTTTVVNVAPEFLIGAGDSNSAELTETGAANLTVSGTATLGDVGVEDTLTLLSGVTVETSGPRGGLSDDDFLTMFVFSRPIGTFDINWGFNSGAETFAYLDLGETLEITYQIRTIDDDGGIGTGEFTIQIHGSQNAVAPVLGDLDVSDTTEGVAPVLSGSFSDLNVGDTHTLTVNWGDPENAIDSLFAIPAQGDLVADQEINADDGSILTIVSITDGVVAFSISGRAYRDDPADGLPDEFEATVRITDSTDRFGSSTVKAVVENTDPVFDSLTITPSVEESGEVTVTGTIVDPGVLDEFVIAINWDGENDSEGAPQVITLGSADIVDVNGVSWDASTRIFSVAHTYADDNPTDTASDTYRVEVSLRDNDPEYGADSLPLSTTTTLTTVVNNVAPGFTLLPGDSLSAAFTENGSRLSTFDTITRTDVGSLDTHSPSVGDAVVVTGDAGDLTQGDLLSMFEFNYADDDPETFVWAFDSGSETFEHLGQDEILTLEYEIRLTDDDGGVATENVTITITGFEEEVAPYAALVTNEGTALFSPSIREGESIADVQFVLVHENRDQSQTVVIGWGDPNDAVQWNFSIPPISEIEVGDVFTSSEGIEMTVFQIGVGGDDAVLLASLPGRVFQDDPETFAVDESFRGTVTVTDEAGLSRTAAFTVEVRNVDPVISDLAVTPEIDEAGTVTVSGTITDPGVVDTFQITIDWDEVSGTEGDAEVFTLGDTAIDTDALTWDPATRVFAIRHLYADDNPTATTSDDYEIEVSVIDNDHGSFAPHPIREWEGESIAPETRGRAIAADDEGTVTASAVEDILNLTRHDEDGEVVWTTTLEDEDLDIRHWLADLALAADGTSYVATSIGDRFRSDAILIALDADGNKLWEQIFESTRGVSRAFVAVDADGNIFTAFSQSGDGTYSIDGVTFDVGTILSKTDPSGHVLWTTAIGDQISAGDLVVDGSGDVFLSSRARSGAVLNGLSDPTSFIAEVISKLSGTDGSIANHTVLGEGQSVAGIDFNSDGDLVILGAFEDESGNGELRILEMSPGGDVSVLHSLPLSDNEPWFNGFVLDPRGLPVIAGGYDGIAEIADRSFSGYGEFLLRVEADGSIGWVQTLGLNGVANDLAINENGDFFTTARGDSSIWKFVEPENATPAFRETLTTTVNNVDPVISVGVDDTDEVTLTESGDPNLTATGTLTFTDVGVEDSHTASVSNSVTTTGNIGDLTETELRAMLSTTVTQDGQVAWVFDSGSETFEYLDDGESLTLDYELTVSDDDTGEDSSTVSITVTGQGVNVGPFFSANFDALVYTEGQRPVFEGRYFDPNTTDSHTLAIDWGDGTPSSLFELPRFSAIEDGDTFESGDGSVLTITELRGSQINFRIEGRVFADDAEDFGLDGIQPEVTITDSRGLFYSRTYRIEVLDVDPEVEDLTITPNLSEGEEAMLSGRISDPGVEDTFVLQIDWDSGSGTEGEAQVVELGSTALLDEGGVTWDPETRDFSISHRYSDDDPTSTAGDLYEVSVRVLDQEHPSLSDSHEIEWRSDPADGSHIQVQNVDEDSYSLLRKSDSRYYLAKRDSAGEVIWESPTPFRRSSFSFINRVAPVFTTLESGHTFVIGETGSGSVTLFSVLPDGSVGSQEVIAEAGRELRRYSITSGADGNAVIVVEGSDPITMDGQTFDSTESSVFFQVVGKLNSEGEFVWSRFLNDPEVPQEIFDVASNDSGETFVLQTHFGVGGLFVDVLDTDGNERFSFPVETHGLYFDDAELAIAEDGSVIVSFVQDNGRELVIAKFSREGTFLEELNFSTVAPNRVTLTGIEISDNGDVVVLGETDAVMAEPGGITLEEHFLIKWSVDGEIRTFDLETSDARSLSVTGSGDIYVAGGYLTKYTQPENHPLPDPSIVTTRVENVSPTISILQQNVSGTGNLTGTARLIEPGERDELLLLIDWGSSVSRIELPAQSEISVGDTFTSPDGTTITITGTGDSTRDFTFEHQFETAGDLTVNFLVEDDDTGFSRTALNLTIPSLGTEPTSLADSVVASLAGGGRILEGFRLAESMAFDDSGVFASLSSSSDDGDSADLPLLRVSPVYTGMARPGSVITVRILGGSGELLPGGDLTIVADAGGNWSAVFADLVLGDGPHYIVVEQSAPSWTADEMGLGSTTLFFSPGLNHGLAELGAPGSEEPRLLSELSESEMAALAGGAGGTLEEVSGSEPSEEPETGSEPTMEEESGDAAPALPEDGEESASLEGENLFPEAVESSTQ